MMIMIIRGAATGGTGVICPPPPTLKSRGTSYVLAPPPTFTTTFILIGWSPYIQNRSSAPNDYTWGDINVTMRYNTS